MGSGTDSIEEISARVACWVMLAIPMGMLESAYPIEYPIVGESNPWIDQFERILVGIAEFVYRIVPFDLATIGEEAPAFKDVEKPLTAAKLALGGYLVSPRLANQLKPTGVPMTFPTGLLWFPWAS